MKIGMLDSGIGGLSVLYEALHLLPPAHYIYYGDTDHVPYGEKTEDEVQLYVRQAIEFLISKGVDAILIACNTATTVATQEFRSKFCVPIVGMEPAVKKAVELYGTKQKRILVAATPITIAGKKLHTLIEQVDQYHNVDLIALPQFVRFAERNQFSSAAIDQYLNTVLKDYSGPDYSALVLGCTHFNYFKPQLRTYFGQQLHFVDGNHGTLMQLMRVMPDHVSPSPSTQVEYYFSGRACNTSETATIQSYLHRLEEVYSI